jgi:catechol 2,3-dioxygenase-like lactoylglutathione lyase family enzyme
MMVNSIRVVSVPVGDQDRAKSFYVDRLGFRVLVDGPAGPDGGRWVMLGTEDGGAAITLVTWFPSMPAGSLKGLVLGTGDVERTAQELASQGVAVSPVEEAPWGRYVTLDDSEGNGLVLQQDVS